MFLLTLFTIRISIIPDPSVLDGIVDGGVPVQVPIGTQMQVKSGKFGGIGAGWGTGKGCGSAPWNGLYSWNGVNSGKPRDTVFQRYICYSQKHS